MDTHGINELAPLWTDEEVAAYLRVEVSTVQKWAKQGRIPVRKAGSLNRFDPKEIEAWTRREAARQKAARP